VKTEKSIDEVLQEEFLRERAAVLGKAAEKLKNFLMMLDDIDANIRCGKDKLHHLSVDESAGATTAKDWMSGRHTTLEQINHEIEIFNKVREKAKTQYYYLIVTREALGLRKHHWVEKYYAIPPKKKLLKDII
jgi:hypothetical protein